VEEKHMASHLIEMGRSEMRCRDEQGKYTDCPTSLGCGVGGCSLGGKLVPFDLPVIGGEVGLDITDAMTGLLVLRPLTGIGVAVVKNFGGEKWSNGAKLALGGLSIVGLAFDQLRDSSMFLGWAFPTAAETTEPLTDKVAEGVSWLLDRISGGKLLPAPASPADASQSGVGMPPSRRVGQERGGARVRPSLPRPADLIAKGSRVNGTPNRMMGSGGFRDRPIINRF
jgi:hypothetical protein